MLNKHEGTRPRGLLLPVEDSLIGEGVSLANLSGRLPALRTTERLSFGHLFFGSLRSQIRPLHSPLGLSTQLAAAKAMDHINQFTRICTTLCCARAFRKTDPAFVKLPIQV